MISKGIDFVGCKDIPKLRGDFTRSMSNIFEIPVTYKETDFSFTAKYVRFGYTHKFEIIVGGQIVIFEPDEEGNFRATTAPFPVNDNKPDKGLLKEIANTLDYLFHS